MERKDTSIGKNFKRTDISDVIVYVTKPVGKVIGEFEITEIIEGDPIAIWEQTKKYSGIDKKSYMEYFKDNKKGFALAIKNTILYQEPLDLYEVDPKIKTAPQSFMYI